MKRFYGLSRVLGLSIALLVVVSVVVIQQAEARFAEVLHGFGEQLAELQDLSTHSAPRKLFVNGLELGVVSASTKLSVSDALDRFQSLCHGVGKVDVPAVVRQKLETAETLGAFSQNGVIREQSEHEGFVACLDMGERLDGVSLLGRLQEFGRTQDLKSLGGLRYALARRHGETSTLVLFWTEGNAKFAELFPKGHDAPGRDLFDVPRPAQAKRVLSAFEQGQPYGLAFYRIEGQSLSAVRAAYDLTLQQAGWRTEMARDGSVRARKVRRSLLVRIRAARRSAVLVSVVDVG
jgi:hypothetical protein